MESPLLDIALTSKQRQWLAHIESAEQQNLSLADYAKQHNLSIKRLYSWKTQLKRKGLIASSESSPSFVKAQVNTSASVCRSPVIDVWLPNGIRLGIPFQEADISALVRELTSL